MCNFVTQLVHVYLVTVTFWSTRFFLYIFARLETTCDVFQCFLSATAAGGGKKADFIKEVLFNKLCLMVTKQRCCFVFFKVTIKMTRQGEKCKATCDVRHREAFTAPLTPVPTAGISVTERGL